MVVADDDPSLRLLCRVNLEHDGFHVLEAESAAALDDALAGRDARLVLLDVRLGSDDGVELARRLRAERPQTAIVFFTGHADRLPAHTRALADGVLAKPFSLEALSETARRLAPS